MATRETFDQNYTKTKFPTIFRDTYWGRGIYPNIDNVIENRNNFVINNHITKSTKIGKRTEDIFRTFGEEVDHQELYINNNKKYILIVSPYNIRSNDHEKINNLNANGWILVQPLYLDSTMTFMKIRDI